MATSRELETQALTLPEQATALRITDAPSYDGAWTLLKAIKGVLKQSADHHAPIIQSTHAAWKTALAARAKIDDPLLAAERQVKGAIGVYDLEQERARNALAATLQQEAVLNQAIAAEAAGENPDAVLSGAVVVPPVIIQPTSTPPAGSSIRKVWKAQVVDVTKLIKACASGAAPMSLLQVNTAALTQLARATKGSMPIDGVAFLEVPEVAVRHD